MSSRDKVTFKILLANTSLALVLFFTVFYMLASLLYGVYGLEKFDGKTPFDFKRCCVGSDINTVNFLSLGLTYIISTGLFLLFIHYRLWDYGLTTCIVHLGITCAVMWEFPTNWQWLATLGVSVLFMVGVGELCCRFCFLPKVEPATSSCIET